MGTMLPGGQLMNTTNIENYPGFPEAITGPELMMRMKEQALQFGVRVISEQVASVDLLLHPFVVTPTYTPPIDALTVILATGAIAKWLGAPNEERLAQTGGGVSACAVGGSALPVYRERDLAVVGGGHTESGEVVTQIKISY